MQTYGTGIREATIRMTDVAVGSGSTGNNSSVKLYKVTSGWH